MYNPVTITTYLYVCSYIRIIIALLTICMYIQRMFNSNYVCIQTHTDSILSHYYYHYIIITITIIIIIIIIIITYIRNTATAAAAVT